MLALVTDSTCGLTRNEAAELGVDVLPMGYAAAGVRHAEGFVGENGDYAAVLSGSALVTTEAVRPSAFERAFRRHLDAGDDVLCVTISSRLSGTFRSAEQAAEAVADARVTVFDSWETAGALKETRVDIVFKMAFGRPVEILISNHFGSGKAVVNFGHIYLFAGVCYTGHFIGFARASTKSPKMHPIEPGAIVR